MRTTTRTARRHAAALTLFGWYLMIPPQPLLDAHGKLDQKGTPLPYIIGTPDDAAPISQWSTLDVFDSAAACKAALSAGQVDGLDAVQKGVEKYVHDKTIIEAHRASNRAMYDHARCIASDDPRLKEK